ncbi:MAG: ComEC/Rec2 family competence protein [Planctomycetota bacterium]|nr:MAG: ComEC/Rec2 family competence protein [Planctomycetota bacterium]
MRPSPPIGAVAAALFVLAAGVTGAAGGLPPEPAQACAALAVLAAATAALGGSRAGLLFAAVLLGAARAPGPAAAGGPDRPVRLRGHLQAVHREAGGGWEGRLDRLRRTDGRPLDRPGRTLAFRTVQGRPPAGDLELAGLLVSDRDGSFLDRAVWSVSAPGRLGFLAALRNAVRRGLDRRLPPAEAGLGRALLLGERTGLPPERGRTWRALGLLHLLAISGLHLWLWDRILRRLLPARLAGLRLAGLVGVAALAGGRPPVVRALAAVLVRSAADHRGRRLAPASLWATALWAELVLIPARPAGLGLVLSYSATAAILARPRRRPAVGPSGRAAAAFALSGRAFLGTAPWLHAATGTLQPASLLLSPPLGAILPLRLTLLLVLFLPGVGPAAAAALVHLGRAEDALFAWADRLPGTPLPLPLCSSIVLGLLCAALLAAGSVPPGRSRRALAATAAALGGLLAAGAAVPSPPRILALPVGHGSGILIAGERGSLLFDLGAARLAPREQIEGVLLPTLRRHRAHLPGLLAPSHEDHDHVAGLRAFAADRTCFRLRTAPGRERRLGGLDPWRVRCLGSRPVGPEDRNGRGQALEVLAPDGRRAVLLGDQEGWSLRELARRLEPGPIDLLLLPHHGLATDGLPELLDRLRPRLAWASCGAGDLPLPAAAHLARRGIPLRTTLAGELVWPEEP